MHETRAQILDALSREPLSGPDIAAELGITRAAVWKQIESLRDSGFEIAGTEAGYRLKTVPEFGPDAIEFGLSAPYEIAFHDSIDSTNLRARELAGAGESNIVVVADEQTGGRGRLDRDWFSPPGGIWLSILVRPQLPATQAPIVTLAGAVATARAVRSVGIDASIKWPNDVLVDGKKVAGILTEMEGEADRISWVVVGIGLNANFDDRELPPAANGTSLQSLAGPVDRRECTQTLLDEFDHLLETSEEILPAWRDLSSTLGRRVRIETPSRDITGRARDVEFPGTLVVETHGGTERVTVGDCEHLRPESDT